MAPTSPKGCQSQMDLVSLYRSRREHARGTSPSQLRFGGSIGLEISVRSFQNMREECL